MKHFNFKQVLSGLLFFGLFTYCPSQVFSQGNNNTLSFAPNFLEQTGLISILPSFPTSVIDTYHGQSAVYAHTAMQDGNGDILFFIVDENIYDAEGYLIETIFGEGYLGLGSALVTGTSEILVVPDPYNCSKYFIFACGISSLTGEAIPFFTILDLELPNTYHPNRLGAVNDLDLLNYVQQGTAVSIPRNTPNFLSLAGANVPKTLINCYFAAPKVQDCQTNQYVYLSSGFGVFQYIIDENGFSYTGQFIPYPNGFAPSAGQRGEMEIIELGNGNFRLAAPYNYQPLTTVPRGIAIFHCELDQNHQLINGTSDAIILIRPALEVLAYINGLEFSNNGDILYVTHDITPSHPNPIEYYDFSTSLTTLTPLNVTDGGDFENSQIETNTDGLLIFATSDRIAALSAAYSPSTANWNNSLFSPLNYPSNTLNTPPNELRGQEAYIIPKQIKQRSYSDYIYEGGCTQDFGSQTAFNGTWSPGNNPFNSQNGDVYIDFTLVIPAGSNLFIEDMNFFFAPGAKVIVERGNAQNDGAWLTLRRTVFSVDDRCDATAMWHGVEVRGYTSENQVPFSTTRQGFFRMFDNSGIEHSYLGAATGAYATENTYPFRPTFLNATRAGGIIQATSSYFKNNRNDVQYHSYTAPNGIRNQGSLVNCDFFTNGLLNDPTVFPNIHILTVNVDGVSMKGIRVRNETPDDYIPGQQGVGVASLNSRFFVDPRCLNLLGGCTNFQSSEFKDLYYGVYALSSNGMRTFRVDRNDFINNYYGIYASGINSATITRNNFEVYRSAAPNEVFDTYGVFLNSCDGYAVEENFFTEFDDPNVFVNGNTYGVIVQNSGINDNRIYKNEFTNLLIGGQAQGINGRLSQGITPLFITGLEFKCNTFQPSIFEADLALTSGRIRYEQGDCVASLGIPTRAPAGNLFSYSNLTSQNDFAVNPFPTVDQEVQYHHHGDDPVNVPVQPLDFNTTMMSTLQCASPQNLILFDENNSCPSEIISIGTPGVTPLLPIFRFKLDSLKQLITDNTSLIDNGNTNGILTLINNNINPFILRNVLMAVSPYVSDEVLVAYLESSPPNWFATQVVIANSPVTTVTMDALSDMNLPNWAMRLINRAQQGTSDMELLMAEVNYHTKERTNQLNQTIRLILNDTIMVSPLDTIAAILQEEDNRTRREQLCETFICNNDQAAFSAERNALAQASGVDNFIRMADINMVLSQNGRLSSDTLQLDNVLREEVESIALDQTDRINAARGEALLDFMLNVRNLPLIEKIDWVNVGGKSMAIADDSSPLLEAGNIKLYPNPTNGEAVTLLFSGELPENPTVVVYSLAGAEMSRTTFETNAELNLYVMNLNTGLYIVAIESNGQAVENLKLIIK